MGLDTSHDCWHGPCSSFMEWRQALHHHITGEPATREALIAAWLMGRYADQEVPLNVLMNHSDCDGEIPAEICGPLADELQVLAGRMPESQFPFSERAVTDRFIAGLRRAATAQEPVLFH